MSSKWDDDSKYRDEDEKEEMKCHATSSAPSEGKDSRDDITDDELIQKIQEFFYGDETLTATFETFVKKNAHIVDFEAVEKADEYKLEYTQAFNEYKALFEEKMVGFIEKKLNSSIERFYRVLKTKTDEDEHSNEGKIVGWSSRLVSPHIMLIAHPTTVHCSTVL
jgi:The ARF-like 2 binding protein BART